MANDCVFSEENKVSNIFRRLADALDRVDDHPSVRFKAVDTAHELIVTMDDALEAECGRAARAELGDAELLRLGRIARKCVEGRGYWLGFCDEFRELGNLFKVQESAAYSERNTVFRSEFLESLLREAGRKVARLSRRHSQWRSEFAFECVRVASLLSETDLEAALSIFPAIRNPDMPPANSSSGSV